MNREEIRKVIKNIEEKQKKVSERKAYWLEVDRQIALSILRRTKQRS